MLRWTYKSTVRLLKHTQRSVASAPTPAVTDKLTEDNNKGGSVQHQEVNNKEVPSEDNAKKNRLVSAAFASLNDKASSINIDQKISSSKTPEELLSLVDTTLVSKKQAFKLGHSTPREKLEKETSRVSDLSVVLGVTGDDEAARLVSTISLQQMIKVLTSLATKKRRSTPLLRSLSFNIGSSKAQIDIKQGADILYALATLNFPDETLLGKVCSDIEQSVAKCQKTAVIGSIATSLGILRYKNIGLLNALCDWVVEKRSICRIQDLYALIHTLATVDAVPKSPENFFEVLTSQLKEEDSPTPVAWLEIVWSLVVLGKAEQAHIESVLGSNFIEKLSSGQKDGLSISSKRKLLNINGMAKWTKGYKGGLLDSNQVIGVPFARSKEKEALVTSVLDSLSNLLPSAIYLRTNIDTGMGFLLDGECMIDGKMTPLPVVDKKTGEPVIKNSKGTRIAIMVWDYHDYTRGVSELSGLPVLYSRLISQSGYKLLSVSYTEYNQLEKLSTRVQYLEKKLKNLVKPG